MKTEEQKKQYFKEYYKRNQDKMKAYQTSYYNKKAGKITKPIIVDRGNFTLSFN